MSQAFGWQTQMLDKDMGNYVVATTTETDENGPQKPGAINGGFFPKKLDWPAQYPSLSRWTISKNQVTNRTNVDNAWQHTATGRSRFDQSAF